MSKPTFTADPSQNLAYENSNNNNNNSLRDASFSSYLNRSLNNSLAKLGSSSRNLNFLGSTEQGRCYLGIEKQEDEEIDVFGAEKYFNGRVEAESPKITKRDPTRCHAMGNEPMNICPDTPKVAPRAPNFPTESGWNNRIALLLSIPRNQPRKKTDEHPGKSFFPTLGCNCFCTGKNSVETNEDIENGSNRSGSKGEAQSKTIIKEPSKADNLIQNGNSHSSSWLINDIQSERFTDMRLGLNTEDRFTFPILKSELGNLAVKIQLCEGDDDMTRKSLEVFGSPRTEKGRKNLRRNRRLDMLSWDAIPQKVEEIDAPASSNGMCNDAASDASSDLFEIDSLTNTANSILTRQQSDSMSTCVTPGSCYAPSEASIDWSIVTEKAVNYSAISGMEDAATRANSYKQVISKQTQAGKDAQKHCPGILSGCRSHKAIRAAGDAYRMIQMINPDS